MSLPEIESSRSSSLDLAEGVGFDDVLFAAGLPGFEAATRFLGFSGAEVVFLFFAPGMLKKEDIVAGRERGGKGRDTSLDVRLGTARDFFSAAPKKYRRS